MTRFKAVIFDLDGTLLDTLTSLWYCANRSLKKEGLKELPKDNFRYYAGDGSLVQVQRYLKDTVITEPDKNPPDPHDPDNLQYYYDSYISVLNIFSDYEVKPYEGIPELLGWLKDNGIKIAVLSNKPDTATQSVITKHFGHDFDIVLGKKDDMPKKPDPKGAYMIAGEFGLKPEEIIYVGDTNTDMLTGKNAGMYTVGALWGFRDYKELAENGADIIISHPSEIRNLIMS